MKKDDFLINNAIERPSAYRAIDLSIRRLAALSAYPLPGLSRSWFAILSTCRVLNSKGSQLAARRSVRAFEDRDIPGEVRAAILEAAAQAPTAGNQQLYTILDVTDPQLKARLAETCDHQPFIATAPMVLIFLADVCKWLDAYREAGCEPRAPGAGDVMLAASDAAIAAQNAVTAAWSLGVGSC